MRRFKLFMSSMLAIIMLIGLVPSKYFEKEIKAEENSYSVVLKLDSQVIENIFYKNKVLIAYKDSLKNEQGENYNVKISLFEGGQEKVLKELILNNNKDIYVYTSYDNQSICAIKITSTNELEAEYMKFDFNGEDLIKSISKEEYDSLTFQDYQGGINIADKITDDEKETVLQKINKTEGLNLTIKDKEKVKVDEYYYKYVNDTNEISINLKKDFEEDQRIVSFNIDEYDKITNETNRYKGIVFEDYVFIRKDSNDFSREVNYAYEKGNLYIWQVINDFTVGTSETNITRVYNGELISTINFDKLPYNATFSVNDGKIYIYRANRIYDIEHGLYIYELKNNEYILSKKLNVLGLGLFLDDMNLIIEEDSKVKLVYLKYGNIEELCDITEAVGGYDNVSSFSTLQGDKDNMVFNPDSDRVIIIQKYTQNNNSEEPGWNLIDGKWYYFDESGNKTKGWLDLNNKWYYLNDQGQMMTSWNKIGNTWYYLKASGEMATGWNNVGSSWYFMNNQGAMQTGWLNDKGTWYYLNDSGEMATGWNNVGSSWYFMNGQGAMQTGWLNDKGTWYYLNISGDMATGWNKVGSNWYLMNGEGQMMTGWNKIGSDWYYLKDSGEMVTGWQYIDSTWYWFNGQGVMA